MKDKSIEMMEKIVSVNEDFFKTILDKLNDIDNRVVELEKMWETRWLIIRSNMELPKSKNTDKEDGINWYSSQKNIEDKKPKWKNQGKRWNEDEIKILINLFYKMKDKEDYKYLISSRMERSPYSVYCQLNKLNLINDETTKLRCGKLDNETHVKILFECDKEIEEISKIVGLSEEGVENVLIKLDLIDIEYE